MQEPQRSHNRLSNEAAAAALALGAASVVADSAFYGRPTSSVANFLWYNVVGGGDSALYGIEGPWFYLHNGLLNLNVVLPLGLLPLSWPLYGAAKWDLLACVAPCAARGRVAACVRAHSAAADVA